MNHASAFPLVRRLSSFVTPVLLRLPISANQVTATAMILGLAGAWCLAINAQIIAALLLIGAYILDNCDGEVARSKNQCSEFGKRFDSFVDWIVHAAFFLALGYGVSAQSQSDIWAWFGYAAAAGSSINYFIGQYLETVDARSAKDKPPEPSSQPEGFFQWTVFVFRELSRADFCFLVLMLALVDGLWFLLPAGAIGAQVYWALQFLSFARRFHV
ncbi:MAG: CDP-alcohol phosphatidyltransferase family protein [Alphaproteobacteria bacterium]|nr:CDP-alcohol phosphatidyltransferase family protein [Alphaproteobacteria bacterium]